MRYYYHYMPFLSLENNIVTHLGGFRAVFVCGCVFVYVCVFALLVLHYILLALSAIKPFKLSQSGGTVLVCTRTLKSNFSGTISRFSQIFHARGSAGFHCGRRLCGSIEIGSAIVSSAYHDVCLCTMMHIARYVHERAI